MSAWGGVDPSISPWDELRLILSEHCHPPPQKDRALQLLDTLLQEECRLSVAGDLTGGIASQGFAVRPNGDITGPSTTSAFGDEGLGANGVLWGGGGIVPAWGKGVGDIPLGAGIGPWGGDGLVAGGTGWGFPGGSRVASGGNGGASIADEEAAVLSGLALDGPAGPWAPNPVASFELDAAQAKDSRLGAFFMPPAGGAPVALPVSCTHGQSQAPSQGVATGASAQQPPQAQPQAQPLPLPLPVEQPPQGNTAAKFSSVVGGTASGRPQVPMMKHFLVIAFRLDFNSQSKDGVR